MVLKILQTAVIPDQDIRQGSFPLVGPLRCGTLVEVCRGSVRSKTRSLQNALHKPLTAQFHRCRDDHNSVESASPWCCTLAGWAAVLCLKDQCRFHNGHRTRVVRTDTRHPFGLCRNDRRVDNCIQLFQATLRERNGSERGTVYFPIFL